VGKRTKIHLTEQRLCKEVFIMFGRKSSKPTQPKSQAEELLEALNQMSDQHQRRERAKRRGKWFKWWGNMPGWGRSAAKIALGLLLILLVDGMRREGHEFYASLASIVGQVTVRKSGTGQLSAATANTSLGDKDVVATGANGSATIVFPDGSAIQLEPNTQFEVRLMDFARGEVRNRSFMVRAGAAIMNVSQLFGARSQATVCTPNAVAAVRGTGFRVAYNPNSRETSLQVVDGAVQFRTPAGETQAQVGQATGAMRYQLQGVQGLQQQMQNAIANQVRQLTQYVVPMNLLQRVESSLLNLLDPVLQLLGLAPGSWGWSSTNFGRRTACMEALRRLRLSIEQETDAPQFLNPITLEELQMNPTERDRILSAFADNMLLLYRKLGQNNYVVRVRARDKSKTLFELTPAGITKMQG
jgi:hypothetical protein